jgi:phospholipid/cholesterol/gamma-HCH transport system substrate-binding protein
MKLGGGRLALEIRRSRSGFIAVIALIAVTIGAVVVIAGGLRLNWPWNSTYTVRIAVQDAKGVVPGKQVVRFSGIPIGEITGAQLIAGRPVLTLTIRGQYAPLYNDAQLRLRPKTPLDDLYLNIESRGSPSAGKLTSTHILPAERTVVPVDIGKVLDAFSADTRVRLGQATEELGRGLGAHGQDFRAALVELAPFLDAARRLTGEMAVRQQQTRRLVHNFRSMMAELGSRDNQLRTLVSAGAQTFGELAHEDASLTQVLIDFPPALRQLLPAFTAVRAAADQLDPAFGRLQGTARALPAGLAALRSFSVSALPALIALERPLSPLTSLVTALRPTAAGLQRDFSLLAPQAPRLDRVTAKVVPCELAVQKFFSNTLSLVKYYDARGLVARGQSINGLDANQSAGASCAPGGPRK